MFNFNTWYVFGLMMAVLAFAIGWGCWKDFQEETGYGRFLGGLNAVVGAAEVGILIFMESFHEFAQVTRRLIGPAADDLECVIDTLILIVCIVSAYGCFLSWLSKIVAKWREARMSREAESFDLAAELFGDDESTQVTSFVHTIRASDLASMMTDAGWTTAKKSE